LPGNPWFICTLWLADHLTNMAQNENDLEQPIQILQWVADHALPSGILAEQVHPFTGKPLSVSPLTWSHATFVASTRRIMRKISRIHTGVRNVITQKMKSYQGMTGWQNCITKHVMPFTAFAL
jgi:hypothetical protein